MGYALPSDTVVFNAREVPFAAIRAARGLADAGYRPPLPAREITVIGAPGRATLRSEIVNAREGGFMSAHDYVVSDAAATVLSGGDIERSALVDEDWLLTLERQQFVALTKTEPTQQRMAHMLKTGKPLRN
jgi:3-hydroxyacyl-CoA dehydrogenase